jgi:acetyltransferase-like isoleucine patch superfamily enzyme
MRRKDCRSKLLCGFLAKLQISLDYFFHVLVLLEVLFLFGFHQTGSGLYLLAFVLTPYALPLLTFRALSIFFPLRNDRFHYGDDCYSPWIGYYKLSNIYYFFPSLERFLILLRVFSPWLRLWGAKIGKRVNWTGQVVVLDRVLLSVGDSCSFGHAVLISSHLVRQNEAGKILFYIKEVSIGAGSYIGAYSRIGPGVVIPPKSVIPGGTDLYPNSTYGPSGGLIDQVHA